ncbi:hypothetical protein [Oryza sativa Japonica Group]|uniref:Uncharacterized protein n=1 Tax=Oryza sativa subsp. japonica TaxID=39947 RepID=Q5QN69_ORYSJ|nr:hypothetical protein [Oryza sativa Japonica Group]BAD73261.1 hypothetical protein [Oryza sativa Japonica Group]
MKQQQHCSSQQVSRVQTVSEVLRFAADLWLFEHVFRGGFVDFLVLAFGSVDRNKEDSQLMESEICGDGCDTSQSRLIVHVIVASIHVARTARTSAGTGGRQEAAPRQQEAFGWEEASAAKVDSDEDDAAEECDDGAVVLGGVEREVAGEEVLQVLQPPDAIGAQHLDHAVHQLDEDILYYYPLAKTQKSSANQGGNDEDILHYYPLAKTQKSGGDRVSL